MNSNPKPDLSGATSILQKPDASVPALVVTSPVAIAIRAGTMFAGQRFDADTPVPVSGSLAPGADYMVMMVNGGFVALPATGVPSGAGLIGGFHFAPGGNAAARLGGDAVPAINPFSLWDISFRPACPDPRAMTLVDGPRRRFWCDIYLLAQAHLAGTSQHAALIADGDDPPDNPAGGRFKKLDYETAAAVMKHHGKTLLAYDEFVAAAHGVTERSACSADPKRTGLDAARTSQRGVMQATGNMWTWGHDGDPDLPRASIFGGSWFPGGSAGSRLAYVASGWPEYSAGSIGARGRGDHLQLA